MSVLGLSYSAQGGGVYNFVLDNFGGNEMPRSYESSASFSSSANGASILTGPAYRQKYQWVISTIMPTASAHEFDEMFVDWDTDRSAGYPVALGVNDQTFGATVTGNAVFVTPPSYTRMGPQLTLVSFGLLEA